MTPTPKPISKEELDRRDEVARAMTLAIIDFALLEKNGRKAGILELTFSIIEAAAAIVAATVSAHSEPERRQEFEADLVGAFKKLVRLNVKENSQIREAWNSSNHDTLSTLINDAARKKGWIA